MNENLSILFAILTVLLLALAVIVALGFIRQNKLIKANKHKSGTLKNIIPYSRYSAKTIQDDDMDDTPSTSNQDFDDDDVATKRKAKKSESDDLSGAIEHIVMASSLDDWANHKMSNHSNHSDSSDSSRHDSSSSHDYSSSSSSSSDSSSSGGGGYD